MIEQLTLCISQSHVDEALCGRGAIEDVGCFVIEYTHTSESFASTSHCEIFRKLTLVTNERYKM